MPREHHGRRQNYRKCDRPARQIGVVIRRWLRGLAPVHRDSVAGMNIAAKAGGFMTGPHKETAPAQGARRGRKGTHSVSGTDTILQIAKLEIVPAKSRSVLVSILELAQSVSR
jgi:hypothetical protein